MRKLRPLLFFLFASILVGGCVKEEPYECPLIQTGDVTTIDATGAIFHGKIIGLGNRSVIDYGFVWDTNEKPVLGTSYAKSFGTTNQATVFDASINSAFVSGQTYYVRAYIRDEKTVTYGREVIFKSMGSLSQKITGFFPETASWGDTITITGEHFSLKKQENVVLFNFRPGNVIGSSETEIKVVVPNALNVAESEIRVVFLNYAAISPMKFALAAPQIQSFSPESGTYKAIVEIKGKGFHPSSTVVLFDTVTALIKTATYNKLTVEVPANAKRGDINIYVNTLVKTDTSDQKFFNTIHYISGFTPASATFGDEVTIQGEGFSTDQSIFVFFDKIWVQLKEISINQIKVIVPNSLKLAKSKISIATNGQTAYSNDDFTLKSPVITGFNPASGTFRDIITITGNGFNPVATNNIVKFGDISTSVISASNTQLQVKVPDNYYSTTGKSKINVTIGEVSTTSDNDFELICHSISQLSPDNGNLGDKITITGEFFNPVKGNNKVYVGNLLANLYSSSTTELVFNIPNESLYGENNIKVVIGGREVNSSIPLMIYQPWKRLSSLGPLKHGFSFSINGKGYAGGSTSSNAFWQYNPATDSWLRKADIPIIGILGSASTSTSTKGYVIYNKTFLQYDPDKDEWKQLDNFPGVATQDQVAFSIGSKIYVGTGQTNNVATNEFWEYNEADDTWTQRANYLGGNVFGSFAFSLSNKGYIGLGSQNKGIYEYDPVLDSWTLKILNAPILTPSLYYGIGYAIGGKGYFAFGYSSSGISSVVYEFDPIDNSFKMSTILPNGYRYYPIGFSIANKAYIGLGSVFSNFADDFWEFDPSKQKS